MKFILTLFTLCMLAPFINAQVTSVEPADPVGLPPAAQASLFTVSNTSPIACYRWVEAVVPNDVSVPDFGRVFPFGWLTVRGRDIGTNGKLVHILAGLQPSSAVDIAVVPLNLRESEYSSLNQFYPSEAINADPMALIPKIKIDGQTLSARGTSLLETCTARQVWLHRYAGDGVQAEAIVYVWAMQDLAEWTVSVGYHDLEAPAWTRPTTSVDIEFGHPIASPYSRVQGWSINDKTAHWEPPTGVLGRSEWIIFRGALSPSTESYITQRNFASAAVGDVWGVSRQWEGRWLAFGDIGTEHASASTEREAEAVGFRSLLNSSSTFYGINYKYAATRNAGQGGSQHHFGHALGLMALHGDPTQIERLLFGATDIGLRPEHYIGENGDPLVSALYPRLRTHKRLPHFSGRENLAGPDAGYPPGWSLGGDRTNGRTSRDRQHLVDSSVFTYAFTGDWTIERQLSALISMDADDAKIQDGLIGVDRGFGRSMRLWSHTARVLGHNDRNRLLGLIRSTANAALDHAQDRPDHLVSAFMQNRPDPRGVVDPEGVSQPFYNAPFEDIAVVGAYAAVRTLRELGNTSDQVLADQLLELTLKVGVTCVRDWTDEQDGRYWLAYQVLATEDGTAIPVEERGTWKMKGASDSGTDWLASWGAGILPILDAELPPNHPVRPRLAEMIDTLPGINSYTSARFRVTSPN